MIDESPELMVCERSISQPMGKEGYKLAMTILKLAAFVVMSFSG